MSMISAVAIVEVVSEGWDLGGIADAGDVGVVADIDNAVCVTC